jgi:hypothetical protein
MTSRAVGPQTPRNRRKDLSRPRVSKVLIHEVSERVTRRDKSICIDSFEHRFLTTHHAHRLHFTSHARARDRLRKLYNMRVLERFRPQADTGSHPFHYVLDDIGVAIVAAHLGVDVKELPYDKHKALRLVYSPRLAHMTEVNDFFTVLAKKGSNSTARLQAWLSERACAARWKGLVYPDGCGVVKTPAAALSFFLELDGGTESGPRLTDKLHGYAEMIGMPDCPSALLFCFPTRARESHARKSLHDCGITTASAVLPDHIADPLSDNWLPLGAARRVSLIKLATYEPSELPTWEERR